MIPSFGSSARTFEGARSGFLAHHSQTLHGTAIYAYIGVVLGVNVGKYGIHGVSGIDFIGVPNHRAVLLRVLHYTTRSTELFSWSWKPKENIPSQQTCKWILRVGRVFGQNRLPRRPCHPRRPCQLDFGKQDRETVQHRENTKVTKQVPGRDELDQMNLAIGVASPKKIEGFGRAQHLFYHVLSKIGFAAKSPEASPVGGFGGQCRHIWQSHGVSGIGTMSSAINLLRLMVCGPSFPWNCGISFSQAGGYRESNTWESKNTLKHTPGHPLPPLSLSGLSPSRMAKGGSCSPR